MSLGAQAVERLQDAVQGWLNVAAAVPPRKRTAVRRCRFTRPAMIILQNGDRLFATSRNISKGGIGLSHDRPLPLGKLKVNVDLDDNRYIQIRANILWCRQLADNSYISGGEFLLMPRADAKVVR